MGGGGGGFLVWVNGLINVSYKRACDSRSVYKTIRSVSSANVLLLGDSSAAGVAGDREFRVIGDGWCRDGSLKQPTYYYKTGAQDNGAWCREQCRALHHCAGYAFGVFADSGRDYGGHCRVYGVGLQGGKEPPGWRVWKESGTDNIESADGNVARTCYARDVSTTSRIWRKHRRRTSVKLAKHCVRVTTAEQQCSGGFLHILVDYGLGFVRQNVHSCAVLQFGWAGPLYARKSSSCRGGKATGCNDGRVYQACYKNIVAVRIINADSQNSASQQRVSASTPTGNYTAEECPSSPCGMALGRSTTPPTIPHALPAGADWIGMVEFSQNGGAIYAAGMVVDAPSLMRITNATKWSTGLPKHLRLSNQTEGQVMIATSAQLGAQKDGGFGEAVSGHGLKIEDGGCRRSPFFIGHFAYAFGCDAVCWDNCTFVASLGSGRPDQTAVPVTVEQHKTTAHTPATFIAATTTHILGASNKDVSTDGSNEDSGVASSAAISGVVIGIVAVAVAMAALTIVLRRRHGNNPTSKIGRQTAELYNLLLKRVQAEFLLGMS